MASLKDLRRRIRATQSMQQIFKAMEMVAAAKLRRAQARAQAAAPYARKLTEILANLAGAAAELEHPLFATRAVRHTALLVITADRGFAGTYNTNILRAAEAAVRARPAGSVRLITVGRKGRDYFRRRGYALHATYTELPSDASVDLARRLTGVLSDLFVRGEVDRVEVMYTHKVNALVRRIVTDTFLPIGADASAGGTGRGTICEALRRARGCIRGRALRAHGGDGLGAQERGRARGHADPDPQPPPPGGDHARDRRAGGRRRGAPVVDPSGGRSAPAISREESFG